MFQISLSYPALTVMEYLEQSYTSKIKEEGSLWSIELDHKYLERPYKKLISSENERRDQLYSIEKNKRFFLSEIYYRITKTT